MKKITNKGLAPSLSRGFTLIELLVVVAIIAILALIVMLAINPVEMARRSRDSRRLSDLATLRKAIDLSLADGQSLADVAETSLITATVDSFPGGIKIGKYLSTVPKDPSNNGTTDAIQVIKTACATDKTVLKNSMVYTFWSKNGVYVLRGRLESTDNCSAIANDGNNNDYYDIGTDPDLDEVNVVTP